jgi:hypothetical protein
MKAKHPDTLKPMPLWDHFLLWYWVYRKEGAGRIASFLHAAGHTAWRAHER